MKRFFCAALIGAAFFTTGSLAHGEDPGGKHHKHHKVQEWLSLLSDADRAKLRAAKEQALKDAAVQAANQRRKQAEAEYRELLHKEMLKTDPSLKPLLDTITELKKRADRVWIANSTPVFDSSPPW
jgi:hypothetical protein